MNLSAICTLVSYQSGALLTSLLAEAVIAGLVGYYWLGHPVTLAAVAIAATLITHPFVWFLFAVSEGYVNYGCRLAVIELVVVGVEAVAFHWVVHSSRSSSLLLALLTNGFSLLLGILIFHGFGCQ